jgi:hypothetical protein
LGEDRRLALLVERRGDADQGVEGATGHAAVSSRTRELLEGKAAEPKQ